jgi:hypothetical protein
MKQVATIGGVKIYSIPGIPPAFMAKAGATIDADGSPHAYNPSNTGLDYNQNGGYPDDDCYGMVKDASGELYVQQMYHPAPGYFVSPTSHVNPVFPASHPDRYINSEQIPFIALPGNHEKPGVQGWDCGGARLGDLAFCWNTQTDDNSYAVVADCGPSNRFGEVSMALAKALGLDDSPKCGGTEQAIIVYVVFPGSLGGWTAPDYWWPAAAETLDQFGGWKRVKEIASQLWGYHSRTLA